MTSNPSCYLIKSDVREIHTAPSHAATNIDREQRKATRKKIQMCTEMAVIWNIGKQIDISHILISLETFCRFDTGWVLI